MARFCVRCDDPRWPAWPRRDSSRRGSAETLGEGDEGDVVALAFSPDGTRLRLTRKGGETDEIGVPGVPALSG